MSVLHPCTHGSHKLRCALFSCACQPWPGLAPAGYDGENCKTCVAGFYRLEDKCVKCPSAAYMLIFVYAGAIGECPLAPSRCSP